MSVPAYLRDENEMEYITIAKRLSAWALKWCKDERLFSRRERWLVTGDLWNASKNLLKNVKKANRKHNDKTEEEFQEREALLRAALDNLCDIEVLLTIKYEMILEGFNATKKPEPPPEAQTKQETPKSDEPSADGKKRGRRRAILSQDDVDRIFEIFFEFVCKEEELVKGVMRSDENKRENMPL